MDNVRNKAIEDCQKVIKRHYTNGTLAHKIAEEMCEEMEKLKEPVVKTKEIWCTDCNHCKKDKNGSGHIILFCDAERTHPVLKTLFKPNCSHFDRRAICNI